MSKRRKTKADPCTIDLTNDVCDIHAYDDEIEVIHVKTTASCIQKLSRTLESSENASSPASGDMKTVVQKILNVNDRLAAALVNLNKLNDSKIEHVSDSSKAASNPKSYPSGTGYGGDDDWAEAEDQIDEARQAEEAQDQKITEALTALSAELPSADTSGNNVSNHMKIHSRRCKAAPVCVECASRCCATTR